mmetsp:Transcript_31404/g.51248  ORF Transcript_31404/g.51248 Transcript_31404/m.51248 type:complete len:142 (-) Transcript_31404:455-880(-)
MILMHDAHHITTNADRVAWSLADESKMTDLLDGDSALAFKKLKENYAPQLAPSYVRLNRMFINYELAVDEDPEIFLTKLETDVTHMNKCVIQGKSDKTDTDIILHVIAKLPKAYEIEFHQIEHNMEHDPGKVSMKALRTKI